MLADEANLLKQRKREEQIKRWREREHDYATANAILNNNQQQQQTDEPSAKRPSKVKFPQGCVYLAACAANDLDEVKYYLLSGVNINTTNIDGLTALHQV